MEPVTQDPAARSTHPLTLAVRASTRSELLVIGIVLFFYVVISVALAVSWSGHDAAIQMQVAGLGLGLMYVVCIWHSTRVMGPRQTAVFFVLAGIVTFFAEYMGSNYDWFFGAYDYTDVLGPRLGGVPVLVVVVWGVILYSAYMLVDWLLGLGGAQRGTTWLGRIGWSALVALATGVLLSAWDLMVDPFAVSGVWEDVLGWTPWWWWSGGSYLPDLTVWQGSGGIPVSNFAGWVGVPFFIAFVFTLFVRRPDRVTGRLVNAVPLLIYGYLYYTFVGGLLVMAWYDPGLHQAALIGSFTMGPILMIGVLKLARDFWPAAPTPAGIDAATGRS
jgi:uncharacterized membrane protein